jgi:hypothetical protein
MPKDLKIDSESNQEFRELTSVEKKIIENTTFTIPDIIHYEKFLGRRLNERELTIAAVLKNNGVLLKKTDFNFVIQNIKPTD